MARVFNQMINVKSEVLELTHNLLQADRFKVIGNFVKKKQGNPKTGEVIHENCNVTSFSSS